MVVGRNRPWIVSTVIIIASVSVILLGTFLREPIAERKCWRQHVFPVTNEMTFLPDELAMRMATKAMMEQGFSLTRWLPETYLKTTAPDGTKDRFLCRNQVDDRRGIITFTNREAKFHWVNVEVTNGAVVCVIQPARGPF